MSNDLQAEIKSQAIDWFVRLQSDDACEKDKCAFESWLGEAPAHRRVYADVSTLWQDLGNIAERPSVQGARKEALADIKRYNMRNVWYHGLARQLMVPAAATVFIAVLGMSLYFADIFTESTYQTRVGEQKTVILADESIVKLNTDTDLQVDFSTDTRRVLLNRGQAHFSVKSTPNRPFTVLAGAGAVTATGTKFDVRVDQGKVIVTLIEGEVTVTPDINVAQKKTTNVPDSVPGSREMRLHAGQQVAYAGSEISSVKLAKINEIVAWQEGRLIFDDVFLTEALKEVNRYSDHKILIGDEDLKSLKISGMFQMGQVKTFVMALEAYFPIEAVQSNDGDRILYSAPKTKN